MFDLMRFGDSIKDLMGSIGGSGVGATLSEQLSNLNIDPAELSQLGGQDLMATLSELGIDIAQLDPEQLSTLTEQLGNAEVLPQLMELLGDRTP